MFIFKCRTSWYIWVQNICHQVQNIMPAGLPSINQNIREHQHKGWRQDLTSLCREHQGTSCWDAVNIVLSNRAHLPLCPRLQIKISCQMMIKKCGLIIYQRPEPHTGHQKCNKYILYMPQVHWGANQTLIQSQLTMLWV